MSEPTITRIDPELAETIERMRQEQRRSFAGQVNYLLRLALRATEDEQRDR